MRRKYMAFFFLLVLLVLVLHTFESSNTNSFLTGAAVGFDKKISKSDLVTTCGVISDSVEFLLDIYAVSNCFTIVNSDIVIDGKGNSLYGSSIGIAFILGNYSNVTVINFSTIENFAYGVSGNDIRNQMELIDVFDYDVTYGDIIFI